jgi:hypothetical protein
MTQGGCLALLSHEDFLAECYYASVYAGYDPQSPPRLREELLRRWAVLANPIFDPVERLLAHTLEEAQRHPLERSGPDGAALAQVALHTDADKYMYHATHRSKLNQILTRGLKRNEKPRNWRYLDINAHATSGIFFTDDWRSAMNWLPYTGDHEQPTKSCIIRLERSGHHVEKDPLAAFPGALVVRVPAISCDTASVRLYPFSIDEEWLSIAAARDVVRVSRRSRSIHPAQDVAHEQR